MMRRRNMKLKYKLTLLIIGLNMISITFSSIIFYQYSKHHLKNQVNYYLQSELKGYTKELNGWINNSTQVVTTISNIIQNGYSQDNLTSDLLQSYLINKSIADIYIGFEDGSFMSGMGWIPPEGYNPVIRPWYQEAMQAGNLNVSQIYFDLTSEQYAVSLAIPLKDKSQEIIGVLGADILLETLKEKVLEIDLNGMGYAFLTDSEGKIIIHQDPTLVGIYIGQMEEVEGVDMDLFKEDRGTKEYAYKGVDKLLIFEAIQQTKWRLCLAVEEEVAYASLKELQGIFAIITIVTILLGIIISQVFNKNLIRRLSILSNASLALSKGQFDIDVISLGNDEIGEVSSAFNRMKNELKKNITELKLSRAKYKELVENTNDCIYSVDKNGFLIASNSATLNQFEIDSDCMNQTKFEEMVKDFELGRILCVLHQEVLENKLLMNTEIGDHQMELDNRLFNVTVCPISELDQKDQIKGVTVILRDITEVKRYKDEIHWMAYHDKLTKLPNRVRLQEDITNMILRAKSNDVQFAVLYIDLDDFGVINDTRGYVLGDQLLMKVSTILHEDTPSNHTAYRIGGDEFAIIIYDFQTKDDLEDCVQNVSRILNQNFQIDLETLSCSASIGVTIFPIDFTNTDQMMIHTDATLKKAKKLKKAVIQYFDPSITKELENRVLLESGLKQALINQEFVLHYQPIVDRKNEKICGFEALIRWQKQGGELIPPSKFIPILENMVLIHPIGLWIIETAVNRLKIWQEKYDANFTMAINLSTAQLKLPEFAQNVIRIVEKSKVKPSSIEFEITETVLIESLEFTKKQLQVLRDYGLRLSLDDFGTGYSSLNYLQHFDIDKLKIDKSFVDYINHDSHEKSLVKNIISIAHWLHIKTVAEGVENDFQKKYLQENQCDFYQGYLFYKPMPVDQVEEILGK